VLAGAFSALSIPFLLASRRANDPADVAADEPEREKS
jgi:hypothetical protein